MLATQIAARFKFRRCRRWFMAADSLRDLAYVALFFVGFGVLDTVTRRLARFDVATTTELGDVLALDAVTQNRLALLFLIVLFGALAARSPSRFFAPWPSLDHGTTLRTLAAVVVLILMWEGSLFGYNFWADTFHLYDRLALVAFGVGALFRPVCLTLFALQYRVVANQVLVPFGVSPGVSIDDLLVMVVLVIAGAHIVFVGTGRRDTAPTILVVGAAIAAHYFVPGKAKIGLNWVVENNLSNLPQSGETAGWNGLGGPDAVNAQRRFLERFGLTIRAITVAFEVGFGLAALNQKAFRLFLAAACAFHAANFILLGYWFANWVVLDVMLIVVLSLPSLRSWVAANARPARGCIATVAVVLGGGLLFHPSTLAWYDSPVAYGYEVEATGSTGTTYAVPLEVFSPLVQDVSFARVQFGPTNARSGSYGVVSDAVELHQLEELETLSQLETLETEPTDETRIELSEDFMARFVAYANERSEGGEPHDMLDRFAPPPKFWTGTARPTYQYQEAIEKLTVRRITTLNHPATREASQDTTPTPYAQRRSEVVFTYRDDDR